MDGRDEPDIFQGEPDAPDGPRPHNPFEPPTPHEDGDDHQDLVDQDVMARDTEDMLEETVRRLLPRTEADRFLEGLDRLRGHVPETYRRLIIERIFETLEPLDP